MADEDDEQLVEEAERASLDSLAHDLGSLFAARNSNGDVVFTVPEEEGVEERAHRCAARLLPPRAGAEQPAARTPRLLLPLRGARAAHLQVDHRCAQQVLCGAAGACGWRRTHPAHGLHVSRVPAAFGLDVHGCAALLPPVCCRAEPFSLPRGRRAAARLPLLTPLSSACAARVPAGVEAEDDLHELLRAANFLTLTECVQTVVARVVADMVPVRPAHLAHLASRQHCSSRVPQETAAPWLLLAEEGTLGAFDDTLKMNALACLLASIGIVPPGTPASKMCTISTEALALLRGALQRCTDQERLRLRLSFMHVLPGDAEAAAWVVGAEPLLMSPRSPARRPVTFINLRVAPIDVMWIGFEGAERRYTRANDNVDSTVRAPMLRLHAAR